MSKDAGRPAATPTVNDVAREAGVSFATAARALGDYGYVSAKAKEKVEAAAAALGYRRNDVARALASGSTRTVGLVVGDIENPYFAAVSRGVADVLEPEGYTLLLANSDEDPEREARAIEAFSTRVDALVVAPSRSFGEGRTQAVGKPLVLLDRTVRGLDVDSVGVDNAAAAGRAVRHLLELGHERIGVVSAPGDISSTSQRLKGFRAALRDAGIEPDESLIAHGHSGNGDPEDAAMRLLDRPDRPTAVFATENFMTSGTLRAVRRLGLRIPDDLSLVAFDDTDWLPLIEPPITVVAQPVVELGRRAAGLLLERLRGATGPGRRVRLSTELVVRGSCAAPRAR
ncbi:LacI family DNA-binding transcriptional regulator [Patulibacter americanus]|uniref:LacI family DNA-binding transcriptional regulator n=1 Tax=Patulibacter americanus TaxID=588672 RepID=UPI0003B666B3|nr:substrate-binding domain-containing protein [Patulibacter americanus]